MALCVGGCASRDYRVGASTACWRRMSANARVARAYVASTRKKRQQQPCRKPRRIDIFTAGPDRAASVITPRKRIGRPNETRLPLWANIREGFRGGGPGSRSTSLQQNAKSTQSLLFRGISKALPLFDGCWARCKAEAKGRKAGSRVTEAAHRVTKRRARAFVLLSVGGPDPAGNRRLFCVPRSPPIHPIRRRNGRRP